VCIVAATLAGIAFALQQTMVIPALPTLQRDLHTTTTGVTWVLTVFLLVASVATPILVESPALPIPAATRDPYAASKARFALAARASSYIIQQMKRGEL